MKKNFKWIAFAIVVCAVSALNVKVMLSSAHAEDLAMTTLAAIGEGTPGEGTSGEGGSGENSPGSNSGSQWGAESECHSKGTILKAVHIAWHGSDGLALQQQVIVVTRRDKVFELNNKVCNQVVPKVRIWHRNKTL